MLLFSFASARATAADTTPASVKALIADIEASRHDKAVQRISRVGQMTVGNPTIANTGRELVKVLAGCRLISSGPYEAAILRWEKTQWKCKKGIYEVIFGPEDGDGNPYVQVVDLLDPTALAEKSERLAKLAKQPGPIKTVPPPALLNAAEQAERLNQEAPLRDFFGKAVGKGTLNMISESIASNATFRLGTSEPIFKTYLVDMSGRGLVSGNAQVMQVLEKLGKIKETECGVLNRFSFCEWGFENPDTALLAKIHIYDGKIFGADFYYLTRERTSELRELTEKLSIDG